MNKYVVQTAIFIVALTGGAIAQSTTNKAPNTEAPPPTAQLVDARQSGAWSIGVDPARNTVRLANSEADPVPVKVITSGSARKAFQARIAVSPAGIGNTTALLAVPVGKRLVIENISAIARTPDGIRMELNFYTYLDNGDGVGDSSDITFHRIALTDQGSFSGTSIASANHKVMVFADEQIGTAHFGVVVQGRLNAATTEFTQGQVTFSGYIEDLPAVQ